MIGMRLLLAIQRVFFTLLNMRPTTLFLSICLLLTGALVSEGKRAQYWKPVSSMGAHELSLSDLRYIVLPDGIDGELDAAIEDLQSLWDTRYGYRLELVSGSVPKEGLHFKRNAELGQGGAFQIRRDRTRVCIGGDSAEAWSNGIYAIANELMGARWYWDGPLGFEWIHSGRGYFPNGRWYEAPAFVHRQLHPANKNFGRRNRLNRIYSFNHNLAKVFDEAVFETSPEVFSKVNGRRSEPKGSGGLDPQPDFTHPGAVEVAAKAALSYFETNSDSPSYSLSINDNVLFDTTSRTEAVVTPLRYFRRRPDYTDLVFSFMNAVAEQVFDEAGAWQTASGEDRYLTALAYYWTEAPPSIELHPRVMPVLTSDRAQWHDPIYRVEDRELIRQWMDSGAERVATWDYYFGAPYPYPRQFNQWIGESIPYLSEQGIDVFFSQLPAFWGLDGAKAWLAARLLWDPDLNSEELLDEYYSGFFRRAAGPMRQFYETAESYRNENEGAAEWIKLYKDESSIALFSEGALKGLRSHLVAAAHLAEDDLQVAKRIQVVSDAFSFTELYADYDRSRRLLVNACFDGDRSDVVTKLEAFQSARDSFEAYAKDYVGRDVYAPEARRIGLGQSDPEDLALRLLDAEGFEYFSYSEDPDLKHAGSELRNFLGPSLPVLDRWRFDFRPSQDFVLEPSRHAGNNAAGLNIRGADIVSVLSKFPVISNNQYELRMDASWRIGLDNRVYVHVRWFNYFGDVIKTDLPLRFPLGSRESPVSIRIPLEAPNNAYDVSVSLVVSRQYPEDYFDVSRLDFGLVNEK